jgi:uncharacterized protein HemX
MRMKLLWTVLILAGTVLAPVQGQQTTEQQRLEAERQEAVRRAAEQRIKQEEEDRQLIKRFQPRTFKVTSVRDLRDAVASIALNSQPF